MTTRKFALLAATMLAALSTTAAAPAVVETARNLIVCPRRPASVRMLFRSLSHQEQRAEKT